MRLGFFSEKNEKKRGAFLKIKKKVLLLTNLLNQ